MPNHLSASDASSTVLKDKTTKEASNISKRHTVLATSTPQISQWLPSHGIVEVAPSSHAGERYVISTMFWDTPDQIAGFGRNSTYEHDFFLNNSEDSQYGPGTYLTDAQSSITAIPEVTYWTSNLPHPYLDTRFDDPDYIKSYTIGCADGNGIQDGILYTNYISAANGTASIDNGFLQGQRGHRFPESCYTTWCVFGDQTVDIFAPYEIDPIPGTFPWQYLDIYLPVMLK